MSKKIPVDYKKTTSGQKYRKNKNILNKYIYHIYFYFVVLKIQGTKLVTSDCC